MFGMSTVAKTISAMTTGATNMLYKGMSLLGAVELPDAITEEGGFFDSISGMISVISGIIAGVALLLLLGIFAIAGIKTMVNGHKDKVWEELGQTAKTASIGCAIACGASILVSVVTAIIAASGMSMPSVG